LSGPSFEKAHQSCQYPAFVTKIQSSHQNSPFHTYS
jgi:hypothetical protein